MNEMKKILIFTGFLFAIDQGIKMLISYFIGENQVIIIPDFFHIHPFFNNISLAERFINIKIPIIIMLAVCIIAVFFIIFFYRFFIFVTKKWRKLLISFTGFFLTAILCSCFDQIFWGGSLDYICFYGKYIYDLKDFYIDIGFVLIILLAIILLIEYFRNFNKEERKKHTIKWLFKWIGRGCPTNNIEQE